MPRASRSRNTGDSSMCFVSGHGGAGWRRPPLPGIWTLVRQDYGNGAGCGTGGQFPAP